jgi:hypothetical protein
MTAYTTLSDVEIAAHESKRVIGLNTRGWCGQRMLKK